MGAAGKLFLAGTGLAPDQDRHLVPQRSQPVAQLLRSLGQRTRIAGRLFSVAADEVWKFLDH
jgi:hypothetical protein